MPGSQDSQVHRDREVGEWAERFIWASRVPAERGAELEGPTWDLGAPLIAQLVKNPLAMWETWVRSQGWEDPLEKGTATHSSILAWRIWHMQRVWRDWATFTHLLRLRPWVCKQIMGWGILVRTCPSTGVCVCGVCGCVCCVCGLCVPGVWGVCVWCVWCVCVWWVCVWCVWVCDVCLCVWYVCICVMCFCVCANSMCMGMWCVCMYMFLCAWYLGASAYVCVVCVCVCVCVFGGNGVADQAFP